MTIQPCKRRSLSTTLFSRVLLLDTFKKARSTVKSKVFGLGLGQIRRKNLIQKLSVEAHVFDFPESRLHETVLRLQKPRFIPILI